MSVGFRRDPSALAVTVSELLSVALRSIDWEIVAPGAHSGASERDDVVAKGPDGSTVLIETRLGGGSAHFSALAQVKTAADRLQREESIESVKPVLVTDRDVSPAINEVAETVGVDVVQVHGSADEMASAVVEHLRKAG
jgi:hypothetical protein